MKRLVVIRHAKSSWADNSLRDIDRPLNSRGQKDAPKIGTYLNDNGYHFERMISSPAIRAISTCTAIAAKTGFPIREIVQEISLYHADPNTMLEIVNQQGNSINNLALFGHNPGITHFVNKLTKQSIDNIPTCGVAVIDFNTEKWTSARFETGSLSHYTYPKSIGGA